MIDELSAGLLAEKKQNDDLEKKYETQQKQIDELKALLISQNKENAIDTKQTTAINK